MAYRNKFKTIKKIKRKKKKVAEFYRREYEEIKPGGKSVPVRNEN